MKKFILSLTFSACVNLQMKAQIVSLIANEMYPEIIPWTGGKSLPELPVTGKWNEECKCLRLYYPPGYVETKTEADTVYIRNGMPVPPPIRRLIVIDLDKRDEMERRYRLPEVVMSVNELQDPKLKALTDGLLEEIAKGDKNKETNTPVKDNREKILPNK